MMIATIVQQYTPVLCEKSVVSTVLFLELAASDANMLMIMIQSDVVSVFLERTQYLSERSSATNLYTSSKLFDRNLV